MSLRFFILAISWLFPISVGAYLLVLTKVIAKIKREQTEYWSEIGAPSATDPNGQLVVFRRIIFGIGLPELIGLTYKRELMAVRILLSLGVILFITIIAMIYGGAFD